MINLQAMDASNYDTGAMNNSKFSNQNSQSQILTKMSSEADKFKLQVSHILEDQKNYEDGR